MIKRILKFSLLIIFIMLGVNLRISFVLGQGTEEGAITREELNLYVGETKILSASSPKRVVVGNPKVVDIANVGEDLIVLSPLKEGITNLRFWDNVGEHYYFLRVVNENAAEIKLHVDSVLNELRFPNVKARTLEEEGKVIIVGYVKNKGEKELLELALTPLKKKITNAVEIREEDIIEIEAQIIELSKDGTKKLGLTWPGAIKIEDTGSPGISDTGTKWSTLFKVLNLKRSQFIWQLDALVEEGNARILSKPRLVCLSGKEAELLVGGEKPIFSTQVVSGVVGGGGTSAGTNVEYKEFGIKLSIKPTVREGDKIQLSLKISVSEPSGTAEFIGASNNTTAKAYPFNKRNISTELYLKDGQTLGIGGLIKQKTSESVTRTPFLSEIPFLGIFFKKKTTETGGGFGEKADTELFIVMTPTIVNKDMGEAERAGVKEEGVKKAGVAVSGIESPAPVRETAVVKSGGIEERGASDALKRTEMEKEIYSESLTTAGYFSENKPESAKVEGEKAKTSAADIDALSFTSAAMAAAKAISQTPAPAPAAVKEPRESPEFIISKAAPSVEEKAVSDAISEYTDIVRKKILENLTYPLQAQKAGLEGKVRLSLRISSGGELLEAVVKDSSNYAVLDNNTLSVVKAIGLFPSFPSNIKANELWVDVPIDYQLK